MELKDRDTQKDVCYWT